MKSGPDTGRVYVLVEAEATVGRDMDNTVCLTDGKVSRRHARIFSSGGVWQVEDLASRNGTFVDGQKVAGVAPLKSLAAIRIGSTELQFVDSRLPQAVADEERAPVTGDTVEIPVASASGFSLAKEERDAAALSVTNTRLHALLSFAERLAGCVGVGDLMGAAVEAVSATLAPARVIPILAESDRKLRPWFSEGTRFAAMKDLPISTSVVRHSLDRKVALLISSSARDPAARTPSIAAHRIQTAVAVPLLAGGGRDLPALGVLYADRTTPADDFEREDLEWFIAFGAVFARRLETVRVLEKANKSLAVLDREMRREHQILGKSEALREVLDLVEKAAATAATVLVQGESGSGKELVARTLHRLSVRRDGPFEAVNCAALAEGVVESELFGHVKGAFTGAAQDRLGRFELADGGTLFLDEIGELPEPVQAKLLRVLEDGKVRRVGDTKDRQVDVRLVAATHRDLAGEVRARRFREDLYFRLNVLAIRVPPLRERAGDIELLCGAFLERFSDACGKRARRIAPEAMERMRRYPWPGNIRELRNTVERMVVLSEREELTPADLPPEIRGDGSSPRAASGDGFPATLSLDEVEDRHIRAVLAAAGGNRSRAAETLGIDRSTLYAKLRKYRIEG